MILLEQEIIGLNSLLDGEEIPGFKGKTEKNNKKYVQKTAEELMKYEKNKLDVMLRLMKDYKTAKKYFVINNGWYAVCEKYFVALVQIEEGYQFMGIEKNIFWTEFFAFNKFTKDYADEADGEIISYEPKQWYHNIKDGITFEAVVMSYIPHKKTEMLFIYNKDMKRYQLNMLTGECRMITGQTIRETIKKWGSF